MEALKRRANIAFTCLVVQRYAVSIRALLDPRQYPAAKSTRLRNGWPD